MTDARRTCHWFRDALSARIDAEDPGVDGKALDGHVAECGDCRAWVAAAEELRLVTLGLDAPSRPPRGQGK